MKKLASIVLMLLVLAVHLPLFGQTQNGSISGVVTDQSGAVVSGAKIAVTSVGTGALRETVTNGAGLYTFQQLAPQDYKLTASAAGFGSTTATLTVSVGSANTANLKLAVGQQSVSVDVAANSLAGINLENPENSQVINTEQILELPTETRNPYDLSATSGNVSSDPSGSGRGVGFNISGARDSSTDILLDGQDNTSLFSVGVATTVPLDSVQEFRIITSNFGAQYGRASGGIVNVLTKSGTNAFHGTGYEFYRPSTFASNGYYNNANGIPQHRFVRNNFGYSIGGPIFKDKLFFFNNTEWLRVRSSNVNIYYLPTPAFLAASSAATQAYFKQFGATSGTAVNNFVTVSQLSAQGFKTDGASLAAANPLFTPSFQVLQQYNVTAPLDAGGGTPQNTLNSIGRVDFNLSERTQMYARYVYYNNIGAIGSGNVSPYAGYSTSNTTKSQNILYGLTHTFSNSLTGQVQIGGLRYNNNQPLGTNPAGPTLYINSASAPTINGSGLLEFPGYSAGNAGSGIPSGGPQNDIQVTPTFTLVKGRHTLTFGGQYTYIRDNHTFGIYENATESLVQTGTSGAIFNLYNGNTSYFQASLAPQGEYPCVRSLTTGATPGVTSNGLTAPFNPACTLTTPIAQPNFSRSNRYQEGAGFFTDTWKTSSRLTIDAGLRYELYGTQHNKDASLDSNFYFGTTGSLQDRIRAGKILRTHDTAPAGVQNPNGKLWNTNYKQFAPRLGFAYDLTGDGKTSLRGGYGISYERNFGNVTYNVALNPPGAAAVSITTADTGGAFIPISTGVLGAFSGQAGVQKALAPTTVRAVNPNIAPAYNQFYTLSIQRQVTPKTSASVAYTGERGIHNYSIANYNRAYYGPVYEGDALMYTSVPGSPKNLTDTNRLNPQFTSINVRGADGDSYYNALNVALLSSDLYHSGITATVNYTFAHSLDNTSSAFTDGGSNYSNNGGVAYFDPFNHGLDHGNSDFDVKHRISISTIWKVPFFEHSNYLTRAALGGFEVGTIFTASTGTPFTMYDCGQAHATVCPRASFLQKPNFQRTGDGVPIAGSTDDFQYITFPAYPNAAAYGNYGDPKEGLADLPTVVNGVDTFPGGMSERNAFRGPGQMTFNADLNKSIRFTERVSLQLRLEAYNVLNHANSYLIFGGQNDVEYGYVQYQKLGPGAGGNRQLQLAGKIIF